MDLCIPVLEHISQLKFHASLNQLTKPPDTQRTALPVISSAFDTPVCWLMRLSKCDDTPGRTDRQKGRQRGGSTQNISNLN